MLRACLVLLVLLAFAPVARAQDALTLDNFKDRYTAEGLVGVDFGPFDCGPTIFDRSDTFCFNEDQMINIMVDENSKQMGQNSAARRVEPFMAEVSE